MKKALSLLLVLILVYALPACASVRSDLGITVLLDDKVCEDEFINPEAQDDLRVAITINGYLLIDLPFSQAHTVTVRLINNDENVIAITGEKVYMESSNCDNQDCVHMGEITRENLEMRVLGGYIICLPHLITVEVYGD